MGAQGQANRQRKSNEKKEAAANAAMLQLVLSHRMDAVQHFATLIFDHDQMQGLFRVKGLGGAVGVVQEDVMRTAAQEAALKGLVAREAEGEDATAEDQDTRTGGAPDDGKVRVPPVGQGSGLYVAGQPERP